MTMRTGLKRHFGAVLSGLLLAGQSVPAASARPSPQPPAERADQLIPGVTLWAYDLGARLSRRPSIAEAQTPNVYLVAPAIDFNGQLGEGAALLSEGFAGEIRGWLNITAPGLYAFRLDADDGAALFINDQPVADTEDPANDPFTARGAVTLAPGLHRLSIPFYQDRGQFRLRLSWRPPGFPHADAYEPVPTAALRTEPGQTFAVSPGPKRWFYGSDPNRPGDGRPLDSVHPSMTLENIRGPEFRPPVGAMCFLPDGRLAVATWEPSGSVFLLSGLDASDGAGVQVQRFASGLGEPLGIAHVDGDLFITQKQELTRLRDIDNDGIADRYEAVATWPASHNYHEFSLNLVPLNGRFYLTTSVPLKSGVTMYLPGMHNGRADASAFAVPDGPGSLLRIDPATGETTAIAGGLRAPNGMGIGPGGHLFGSDNQGAWLPASRLNLLREGGFYGHQRTPDGRTPADPPVVWFPQGEIGNSPSEPVLIPDGPYRGQMLVGDVTYGGIQRITVDPVLPADGERAVYQGCVFRFSQGLEAGVNRLVWGPDGCLYVGGVGSNGNWNHKGTKFGLQRLRPNGKTPFEMLNIESRADGFVITLTRPVPIQLLTSTAHYTVQTWRYRPSIEYGGPKVDLTTRTVGRAVASPDRTRVFVEVPALEPGTVVYFRLGGFTDDQGEPLFSTEAWYTLNQPSPLAGPAFEHPFVPEPLPTAPPANATVLFDGRDLSRFSALDGDPAHWTINRAGELCVDLSRGAINAGDLITREAFGDCFLHVEWLSPPGGDPARQTNGNSGIKLQSRYEIQVMNTPGREGGANAPKFNEAGSIYRQRAPDHNAGLGAGVWQTYDMRFRAPRWRDGRKTDNARLTLWWNGVLVHDNVEIADKTGASLAEARGDHPLLLQAHDTEAAGPVRYRNIWIVRE